MITKKHFIAVAKMIAGEKILQRQRLALWFADFFAKYNPLFDRQKFLQACGICDCKSQRHESYCSLG